MRAKLSRLGRRLEEIDAMLAAPDAANDMNRFRDLSRERAEIEPVVLKMKEYETTESDIETAIEMLDDPDMAEFAQAEIDDGKEHLQTLEHDLEVMLLPKTPTTARTFIWKFVLARVVMNPPFSPATFSVCTPATPNVKAGALKLSLPTKATWVAIAK